MKKSPKGGKNHRGKRLVRFEPRLHGSNSLGVEKENRLGGGSDFMGLEGAKILTAKRGGKNSSRKFLRGR